MVENTLPNLDERIARNNFRECSGYWSFPPAFWPERAYHQVLRIISHLLAMKHSQHEIPRKDVNTLQELVANRCRMILWGTPDWSTPHLHRILKQNENIISDGIYNYILHKTATNSTSSGSRDYVYSFSIVIHSLNPALPAVPWARSDSARINYFL